MVARRFEEAQVHAVPRFFFHIFDDADVRDDEGLDLYDAGSARRAAIEGARAMICDQLKTGRITLSYRIEIENEAGDTIFKLPFSDAVKIDA